MLKKIGSTILAIWFPWVTQLIYDNPGGAVVALIMQITIIGWIPASIWAFRTIKEAKQSGAS